MLMTNKLLTLRKRPITVLKINKRRSLSSSKHRMRILERKIMRRLVVKPPLESLRRTAVSGQANKRRERNRDSKRKTRRSRGKSNRIQPQTKIRTTGLKKLRTLYEAWLRKCLTRSLCLLKRAKTMMRLSVTLWRKKWLKK